MRKEVHFSEFFYRDIVGRFAGLVGGTGGLNLGFAGRANVTSPGRHC